MDYALLLNAFERTHRERGWSRQRLLHECLRAAIRGGQLAPGTRLAATRVLAAELGLARNTVLYAYEQLASEGFVLPDRRGTVVAGNVGPAGSGAAGRQQGWLVAPRTTFARRGGTGQECDGGVSRRRDGGVRAGRAGAR